MPPERLKKSQNRLTSNCHDPTADSAAPQVTPARVSSNATCGKYPRTGIDPRSPKRSTRTPYALHDLSMPSSSTLRDSCRPSPLQLELQR